TTTETDDEFSGVWFIELDGGPQPALTLPTLAAGWNYEGWAVIDGVPYSTGTFRTASGSDDAATFSGPNPGPPFPGEDFIQGGTTVTFPTDLRGATIVISVEPDPDNEMAPFALKPLVGNVPANALDHVSFDLGQNLVDIPTGTVTR
ncbi:MAG: hypothetical protein KTR13_00095, partial [Saprospiraceae bacterium]|nr:hypothetical protein [Saprospiraceae bacterium]